MEVNPKPVQPGELLDAQISINNPGTLPTGNLSLRLQWPEGLAYYPLATEGGSYPGSFIDPGEHLRWNLSPLGPGASINLGFTETVRNSVPQGTLIQFEVELFEAGLHQQSSSTTIRVEAM